MTSVVATFFSYFFLVELLDFPPIVRADLMVLGSVAFALSATLLRPVIPKPRLSRMTCNAVLFGCTCVLVSISIYALAVTGGEFKALVDARFAVPGYGVVFAMFLSSCTVGIAIFNRSHGAILKGAFVVNAAWSGFVFGGKGFLVPVAFGLAFGYHLGLVRFSFHRFIVILLIGIAGAIGIQATVVNSVAEALGQMALRFVLEADAVNWLAQMSATDIERFPISWLTFVADLFGRLVGERISTSSVGSQIAYVVSGDNSGGGPNPLLPIMAYLLNQGDLLPAIIFVTISILVLWLLIRICLALIPAHGVGTVIFPAIIFMVPVGVIDLVLIFQYIFCLSLIGALSWLAMLTVRKSGTKIHGDIHA